MWNHLSPVISNSQGFQGRRSAHGCFGNAVLAPDAEPRRLHGAPAAGRGQARAVHLPRAAARARGRAAPAATRAGREPPRWVALAFLSLHLLFHYRSKVIFFWGGGSWTFPKWRDQAHHLQERAEGPKDLSLFFLFVFLPTLLIINCMQLNRSVCFFQPFLRVFFFFFFLWDCVF